MAITAADMDDIIAFLTLHPEYRDRLRPVILGDELPSMPGRLDRIEAILEQVVANGLETDRRIDRLTERLDRLAERVDALTADVRELTRQVTEMNLRLNRVEGEMGNMRGELLELRYAKNLRNWFGRYLRPVEIVPVDDLPGIDAALDDGTVTESQVEALRQADFVLRGSPRKQPAAQPVYYVVEVSSMIQKHDVQRAADRAEALRLLGLEARSLVGGHGIQPDANQLADELNVIIDFVRR